MKYAPMLAKIGNSSLLKNDDYIFEPKFDCLRALCFVDKQLHFFNRNNLDI